MGDGAHPLPCTSMSPLLVVTRTIRSEPGALTTPLQQKDHKVSR